MLHVVPRGTTGEGPLRIDGSRASIDNECLLRLPARPKAAMPLPENSNYPAAESLLAFPRIEFVLSINCDDQNLG